MTCPETTSCLGDLFTYSYDVVRDVTVRDDRDLTNSENRPLTSGKAL